MYVHLLEFVVAGELLKIILPVDDGNEFWENILDNLKKWADRPDKVSVTDTIHEVGNFPSTKRKLEKNVTLQWLSLPMGKTIGAAG